MALLTDIIPSRPRTDAPRSAVVPFGLEDDSAVTWAVQSFEAELGPTALDVVHPDPGGVSAADLEHLRARFAWHLRGRYRVSAGRRRGRPMLRFVPVA